MTMEESLSLNIVVDASAAPSSGSRSTKPPKKRKRLNKYERRRRKAALAKAEKEEQTNHVLAAGQRDEEEEVESNSDSDSEEEAISEKPTQETNIKQTEEEDSDDSDSTNDDDDNLPPEKSPETTSPQPPSNRHFKSAQEEADHAAYMAEYHARPLELDRRSGATVKNVRPRITESADVFSQETQWKDLHLEPKIIHLLPYDKPTKIQAKVLNQTSAQNIWIQSETGSGKTLAYFLPILQQLWKNLQNYSDTKPDRASLGTQCLIICPTQELVQQTTQACEQLTTKLCAGQLVVGALRGQASRAKEKARIRKGLAVLVTTPGRLLDHLQTTVSLQSAVRQLKWLVLDEVDRLFDLGLAPQLKQVIELLRPFAKNGWKSTLVSATVPPEVKEVVQDALSTNGGSKDDDWVWIQADNNSSNKEGRSLPKQLVQYHILVSAKLRLSTLIAFLLDRVQNKERTVVFLSTCASVDYYHELFNKMDCILKGTNGRGIFGSACAVDRLHGNVPHQQRHSVLQSFTQPLSTTGNKQARILLATDVAARGLNLHTDWTVQYDPPCEIADYIHRAGRVARAGQMGQSLLFLLPSEKSLLDILQLKQESKEPMPAISLTSTLQQASKLCPDLTNAGMQRNGMRSRTTTTKEEDSPPSSASSFRNPNGSRQGEAFCSELQFRLEECVLEQSKIPKDTAAEGKKKKKAKKPDVVTLLDMARAAFLSHMRAYPTKEKLVRHIFSARALHLGHIAKSFALREPPKTLVKNSRATVAGGENKKKRSAALAFGKDNKRNKGNDSDDEFASNGKTAAQKRAMLMANAAKLQVGGMDGF